MTGTAWLRSTQRLVTILTSLVFPIFFLNLVDRDLTEYQITQTGADKGNPTV